MREKEYLTVDQASLASVIIVLSGLIQLGVNLSIAVTCFGDNYSFSENFLSDLGRTTKPSAPYFNSAAIMPGLSLAVFFANTTRHKDRRSLGVAGIVSAIGLIGIGMTPLDRYYMGHHFFLVMWLLPMFVMIFHSVRIFGGVTRQIVVVADFGLSLLLYIGSAGSDSAPFHQKILVIFAIVWLLLICYHSTFVGRQRFGNPSLPATSRKPWTVHKRRPTFRQSICWKSPLQRFTLTCGRGDRI